MGETAADRSDPAVRAAARVAARERSAAIGSTLLAIALVALAFAGLIAAIAVDGDDGSVVGAGVGGLTLIGLAYALWPQEREQSEQRHRKLEAMWHELRSDGAESTPWKRYAVWAQAAGDEVELSLLVCAANTSDEPSPYRREPVKTVAVDNADEAAEAMEQLRAEAAHRELDARAEYRHGLAAAEQAEHDARLAAIDRTANAELAERERALDAEARAEEQAEREAQAEVIARALRRP